MAILQGFPPANSISPSVRIAEADLSFIAPQQSFHNAGLVGFASKGPINVPTLVTSKNQLNTIFGFPHPESGDPYMIYAAQQYLLVATQLYVVRVADSDAVSDEAAQTARANAYVTGDAVTFLSTTAQPYTIVRTQFFSWKLNGILSSKTLSVEEGTSISAQALVDELNGQLTPDDGIEFYVYGTTRVALRTTYAYGPNAQLELVSIQDALYGPTDTHAPGTYFKLGLGTGMEQAKMTSNAGYAAGYDVPGSWDFAGLTGLTLEVVIDGTQNVSVDNAVQTIDLSNLEGQLNTTNDVVEEINNQLMDGTIAGFYAVGGSYNSLVLDGIAIDLSGHPGYASNSITLATLHHGVDARMLVKSDSTAFELFNFKSYNWNTAATENVTGTTAIGYSPQNSAGSSVKAVGVGPSNSSTKSLVFLADSAGIEGNNTNIVVTNDIRNNVFSLSVYNNGVQVESWGNLTKDQNSRYYVGTYLPEVSDFIQVIDNTDTPAPPKNGTYVLAGGSDGIPSDPDKQDELLIGNNLGYTGLYAFSEPEQVQIDLLAVPGHSSTSVVMAMLDVCQNYRQDCLAIIDPPFGLTVNEIIHWQNGTHPLNTTKLDNDFGALYWPWVKITDTYNRVDVWCPPSGSILAVFAKSDDLSAPWFAAAGINRGVVPNITDVFSRPTLAERDAMYGNSNAINPIVQFSDFSGFVVWGNKTLQRMPTALDRVNVRRLMFTIEKAIRSASRTLLFDPNDLLFQKKFTTIARDILNQVKIGRGLTDFIIVADSSLNTPDVIDRNEFRAQIGVQPTRAVEFMFIQFSINRTGDFSLPATNF